MKRSELVDKLTTISPALANNEMIPILSHVWFTGKSVMAFNDQIAISTPCPTDFSGAIRGGLLINYLKASAAAEATFEQTDSELVLKLAKAKVKLGLLSKDSFVFKMPQQTSNEEHDLQENHAVEAIENCMLSVANDGTVPDQLGITLHANKEGMLSRMNSTNGTTITHARIDTNVPLTKRAVIPGVFCTELLRLAKASKCRITITDEHILATGNGVSVFGRLVDVPKPLNFNDVVKQHVPSNWEEIVVPIPKKFRLALERATIIAAADDAKTKITIKGEQMKMETNSSYGEAVDELQISNHPDANMNVRATYLHQVVERFDRVLLSERCAVLAKSKTLHLIAATTG